MPVVSVRHGGGSYDVLIEPGAITQLPALCERLLPGRRLAAVSDTNVAPLIPDWVGRDDWPPVVVVFAAGEQHKTRDTWASVSDQLFSAGYSRDAGIIAVGGGVVGDIAGFVAATFARGVPYVQVPTTLLAMLDASVGGKTGVDTTHGKNLVGAFHPPAGVIADPLTLATLPERDYRGGLAEAVKHGLIADAGYFGWMESHVAELAQRDPAALSHLVLRSVEIKAAVVSEDEREGGRRATLNAGHTVAHALEQVMEYTIPHGEAVAIGLVAEAHLGEQLGVAEPGTARRVAAALAALGLPTVLPRGSHADRLVDAMRGDKKNRGGAIRFAIPRSIGESRMTDDAWTIPASPDAIQSALIAIA